MRVISTEEVAFVSAGKKSRSKSPTKPATGGNSNTDSAGVSIGISLGCSTGGKEKSRNESVSCNSQNQCSRTTETRESEKSPGCSIGINGGVSGGGSKSRVICTHFFRKGMLPEEVWRADMAFTFKNLSPVTVKGYHLWAIPYVKWMRKSPLAEKIMFPLALWRAEELAYQMGVLPKGNIKGKMVRWIGEPLCFAIGIFSKQGNWAALWDNEASAERKVSA